MRLRRALLIAVPLFYLASMGQAFSAPVLPDPLKGYAGRVVYIDFWASWCGPCARSFPWLNSLKARYGNRLAVVGVNVDEKRSDADTFLASHPAGFSIIYDSSGQLAEFYHVQGMPSAVILDERGQVEHQHVGFRDEDVGNYESAIRAALNQSSMGAP